MILLTKPAQLILEAPLGVMLLLAVDVLHHLARLKHYAKAPPEQEPTQE